MKRIRPQFVLVCLFILISGKLAGQSDYDYTKVIPPSPNAASLGVYGDIPVGHYSGSANIPIPLYTIKTNSHSLDINLQYLSTGFKVSQDASWVGLGWSLNAGGVITRSLRGRDDFVGGYYNDSNTLPPYDGFVYDEGASSNTTVDKTYFEKVFIGNADGEPDLFHYNFGGYSGKFVFDKVANGGHSYCAERNNLKIEILDAGTNPHWIITDANGYKYYFNTRELSYDNTSDQESTESQQKIGLQVLTESPDPSTTAWYLDAIVAPSGESVTFEYTQDRYSLSLLNQFYESAHPKALNVSVCEGPMIPNVESQYTNYFGSRQRIFDVYLKKIVFKNGYVSFDISEREDVEGYTGYDLPAKLDAISIHDNDDRLLKKVTLHHSYFTNGGTAYYEKRLKLDAVTIAPFDQALEASYNFEYYDNNDMPGKYSKAVDHWGYYNGEGDGQSLLPAEIYLEQNGNYRYLPGGNRIPSDNPDDLKKGMLMSIAYPTGGKTLLEYELNDYANIVPGESYSFVPESRTPVTGLPGGNDTPLATIELTEMTPVKFVLTVAGNFDPGILGQLFNGATPIKNFYHGEPPTTLVLQPGTYTLQVNQLADRLIYIQASWLRKVYHTAGKGAGLRIKRITNIDAINGSNVKRFVYTMDGTNSGASSGRILSKPAYTSEFAVRSIDVLTGPGYKFECHYTVNYFQRKSSLIVPFGYPGHEHPIGYSIVNELIGENSEGGRTTYVYRNNPDVVYSEGVAGVRKVFTDNGKLSSSTVYTSSGKKVKSTFYDYTRKEQFSIKGIRILSVKHATPFPRTPEGVYVPGFPPIYYYDNISEWWVTSSVTEKIFQDETNSTNTETIHTYDNAIHKQVTKTDVNRSNASRLITKFKYPQDYASSIPANPTDDDGKALLDLINDHVMSPVIEKQVLVKRTADELVDGELTKYKIFNGRAMPLEVHKLRTSIPISSAVQSTYVSNVGLSFNGNYKPEVHFDKYDINGNVIQFHKAQNVTSSFIWGYDNSFLVAHVLNAASDKVFYTSFENEGEGQTAANAGTPIYKTGYKVGAVPYTFAITPPAGSKMTYWYYTGSWQFSGEVPFSPTITSGQYVDEIRVYPPGAQMTTYTYDPLKGVTSTTDKNNIVNYYEYDGLGRLKLIRDKDRNIVELIEYKYQLKY